ncbi:MAG TPA: hypothetical protein PK874_06790 [Desulfobacteraceae bacterium]|nr:hypothetical protein [Desulfobacteraceae bacterium]HPJ66145.1 hypothetical protein [Desulfobacteraceae bacterium]HPQ27041.1 hypothetical protein [Desulfobacteraceae bacterium]
MNLKLLKTHIENYKKSLEKDFDKHERDLAQRQERTNYYQSWTEERILKMNEDDLYEYISGLWAMLIWGNKHYVVDKIVNNNGLENFRKELAELVWGIAPIEKRWDHFRSHIKGLGPAMISEILCHTHPTECMLWNRRAYVGLNYIGIKNLPRYDYQMTGKKYNHLSSVTKEVALELEKSGIKNPTLLTVDYFIWDELQVVDKLSQIFSKTEAEKEISVVDKEDADAARFIHDEIRDKLADIGRWLGFNSNIERKVAHGSQVDAVWEATIGNMGRVIYVFEVQTKGSIDSLIINLYKCLNNPAVQGVVAVSDATQLEKISKHAADVGDLNKKLKYWDYLEVLQIHEALESVNETINKLGLVPHGF